MLLDCGFTGSLVANNYGKQIQLTEQDPTLLFTFDTLNVTADFVLFTAFLTVS